MTGVAKQGFIGLAAAALLASGAAAEPYKLWRMSEEGRAVVAVSDAAGADGRFAVAVGPEGALDLLQGEAARAVLADLEARRDALGARGESLIAESDGAAGEVIRIRKRKGEHDKDVHIIVRDGGDDVDISGDGAEVFIEKVIEKADGKNEKRQVTVVRGKGEEGPFVSIEADENAQRRLICIVGVDAETASGFIDDADGLDGEEKQAFRAALGL